MIMADADARTDVTDIEDLEDAHLAGTEESVNCTLILTEGKAALSLAAIGLAVIQEREKYGLYPLNGLPINVRKATELEIALDTVVKDIKSILGLRIGKTYDTDEDFKTLRYGKVMLMTDRDEFGSQMKGLIINLFHHYWPSLLHKREFLLQFITPAVKVVCPRNERLFYSFREFEEWRLNSDIDNLTIREYKSLEAFTLEEMQGYFSHLSAHCVLFRYTDEHDDEAIKVAFDRDVKDSRRQWINDSMQESLNGSALYYEGVHEISYKDFINKEVLFACDLNNERQIPSVIDGLTLSQRKVLHACLKRYPDQEVTVLQLIGSVFEVSAYKQSSDALSKTIIRMSQDFVGRHNMNILMPIGQFGTRMHGGDDAGKAKYLYTQLNSVMKFMFPDLDSPILNYRRERGNDIEPVHYLPIIPMILVNGAEGIGTGWRTKIAKYNPKDIIANLFHMLNDSERRVEMIPWFKGFTGTVEKVNDRQFYTRGKLQVLENNRIRITELPIGTWTHRYKKKVLEPMLKDSKNKPRKIVNYEEHHTGTTVNFLVTLVANLENISEAELYKNFHLNVSETLSFVAFDEEQTKQRYENPIKLIEKFFKVRLSGYEKRRTHMIRKLEDDRRTLRGLYESIKRKSGEITIENPEKGEKISIKREPFDSGDESSVNNKSSTKNDPETKYEFLQDAWRFTERKLETLKRDYKNTRIELEKLQNQSAEDMWRRELEVLSEKLGITLPQMERNADEVRNDGHHPTTSTPRRGTRDPESSDFPEDLISGISNLQL